MNARAKQIFSNIGEKLTNIGAIVDTDPNTVPTYNNKQDEQAYSDEQAYGDEQAYSDEQIKDVKSNTTGGILEEAYKKLDDIIYRYNNKVPSNDDGRIRAGVTAQSLENSILGSTVYTDPNSGYKMVDTRHLALANAAAIKEIFERLEQLEKGK